LAATMPTVGLRRRRAPAEGNAMEYAQVRSKSASVMARYRLVVLAVLAAIAMTLGAVACGPSWHPHPKHSTMPPGGY